MGLRGPIAILDLPHNNITFWEMYRTGAIDREIASIIYCAPETVGDYRRKHGLIGNGGSGKGGKRVYRAKV
jgi:hypothetical protein